MYNREVKPFVKWAGGKTRIINFIDTIFPKKMKNGEIDKFIEPFVGGGAVFFHVASKYEINEFIINDNNFSLMTAYKTIKKDVDHLINNLSKIKEEYTSLKEKEKARYYGNKRAEFNCLKKKIENDDYNSNVINFTTLFIFLNKTCYNGLFRLNSNLLNIVW